MARTIPVRTYFLEQHAPPSFLSHFEVRQDVQAFRASHITPDYYKSLYQSVGEDIGWVDRLLMNTQELEALLADEHTIIFILYQQGKPIGFAELNAQKPTDIKIEYFGIEPNARGQGLGKYFLHWVLEAAWRFAPKRIWLHTCELDHPAALTNYLKAGFQLYDEKIVQQVVTD